MVTVEGSTVPCAVESVCLHGDSPGAVAAAVRGRAALLDAGVTPTPFS